MKKLLFTIILVVALVTSFATPVFAQDPEVAITITAELVAMTNTETEFAVGVVEASGDAVKWGGSDTHSTAENTGSVAIDIQLQGTDLEGAAYDWTLAASAGDKNYMLKANTEGAPTVYSIEIQNAGYTDLKINLAVDATYDWSMEFTPPTIFDPADNGTTKTATLTLVASKT